MSGLAPLSMADVEKVAGQRETDTLAVEVVLDDANHYFVTAAELVTGGTPHGVLILRVHHFANFPAAASGGDGEGTGNDG